MQNEKVFHMPATPARVAHQQAIETALVEALDFIRAGHSLSLATERTRRALALLKQANAEVSAHVRTLAGVRND